MNNKKLFAIAMLGLLIAFVGYTTAENALTLASDSSNFTANVTGQPAFNGSVTFDCTGNITCNQDTATKTITIGANQSISNSEPSWDSNYTAFQQLQKNDSYFNSSTFPNSTNFKNDSLSQRILNIELNLSNITMITANGSIVASNLPDGYGNITNVTISGGLIATYI